MLCRVVEPGVVASIKGAFAPTGDCSHLISTGFGMEKKRMGLGLWMFDPDAIYFHGA
jgi:hypothetical protein